MSKNNIHHFDRDFAIKHGLEAAVIIYNFRYWLDKNKSLGSNIKDGFVWTYNTVEAMAKLFPYIKERKIGRILIELEKDGFIKSEKLGSNPYDKTKWYTIPSEYNVDNFTEKELNSSESRENTDMPNLVHRMTKSGTSKYQKLPISQIVNTDSKPYIKDSALQPEQKTVKTQHQQGANPKVWIPERNLEKNKLSPEAVKELKAQMMSGSPN